MKTISTIQLTGDKKNPILKQAALRQVSIIGLLDKFPIKSLKLDWLAHLLHLQFL